MKLNKQQQSAVMLAHETYWESYLKGDVKSLASLLDEGYSQIGSVENEVFFNKKDAVNFVQSTIGQVAGKVEMRNRITKLEPVEEFILITEQCDLYVFIEGEWNFYSKFRASSMMQEKEGAWKMIHQHSSIPDSKAQEGENIATQKIAAENLQLREAVKRRTIELEQKNRELEIETSLERVRTVAMGMNKPDDMLDVCRIISVQLQLLDVTQIRNIQTAIFYESRGIYLNYEYFSKDEKTVITEVAYNLQADVKEFVNKMQQDAEAFFTVSFEGTKLKEWMDYQEKAKQYVDTNLHDATSLNYYFYSIGPGALGISTYAPLKEDHLLIFKRFRNVFELAYRRFNDIEQAAAQAKEAKIEAALEKVRSRTMAMQHSDELPDAANNLFLQVQALGIPAWSAGYCIWDDDKKAATACMSSEGVIQKPFKLPTTGDPSFVNFYEAYKRGELFYVEELGDEALVTHYQFMRTLPVVGEVLDGIINAGFPLPTFQIFHVAYFSHGYLLFITYAPVPEAHAIFKRFTTVFEQTYTRFLDLQKAEAQAREAQIEIGLERLRSRAMAMQNSEELKALIGTVFTELTKLDLVLTRCIIMIFEPQTMASRWWMVNSEAPSDPMSFFVKHHEHAPYLAYIKAWQEKKLKWQYNLQQQDKKDWDDFMFGETELSNLPDFVIAGMKAPERILLSASFNNFGCLNVASLEPLSDEHFEIMLRFAKVFDLTYTRFNDLQKAEAQSREAQIEAALERVRSRTMAMQRSDELQDASLLLFQQVQALGVPPFACGFNIWDADRKAATAWMGSIGGLQIPFKTDSSQDVYLPIYKAAQRGESLYVVEQAGKALEAHYAYLATIPVFRDIILEDLKRNGISIPTFQIIHCAYFSQGYLMFISYDPVPFAYDIFKRFAKVFEQTYTRFLDLQKAEAQAKEAIKASSLDRVRAEIASMRTVDDLQRITPLIWYELTALGVPFIRCGVFIIDEAQAHVQVYLSAPDGHSLAVLDLPFNSDPLTAKTVDHWRKGKVYTEHWNKEDFIHWTKSMMEKGQVQNPETYQGASTPPESLNLHFVPFTQGMLYAGNIEPLKTDEISLVKALAESFSIAYARYEDFKQLEKAKQHIESTLTELKATQSQLIQSEKMASLGQLTAGIAHEIQNPLNFVNNFSEVNTELIEELKGERQKAEGERNTQLEDDLLNDLSINMEKINHHGKRADAIVKGMLQHSRSSTAEKEPTDINKLADEYLRLAYHGLRAKDKSFNASLKTDYDESIGKINIIPQDIGRVILNLINNAFYVVSERQKAESSKQKAEGNQYEPTVSVSTKRTGNLIELKVSDNGKGIPPKVLDKIFQPFFTTKPTGQGTGLGLSLSYDIVKAHGGEIKVETKEGKGTEFIIQLPINTTT